MEKLFNEVRLTVISWCFALVLKLAPKNKEGLIIIEAIHQLTMKSLRCMEVER